MGYRYLWGPLMHEATDIFVPPKATPPPSSKCKKWSVNTERAETYLPWKSSPRSALHSPKKQPPTLLTAIAHVTVSQSLASAVTCGSYMQ